MSPVTSLRTQKLVSLFTLCHQKLELIGLWVQLALTIHTWMWSHPLEHWQPTLAMSTKKNGLLSLSGHSLPLTSQVGVGPREPFHHPCWNFDLIYLVQVVTVAMNSWVNQSCNTQKTEFHNSPSHLLALPFFLSVISWSFLSIGWGKINIDDLPVAEHLYIVTDSQHSGKLWVSVLTTIHC